MILKASQRGGAKQLGLHLLKTEENEHVELHELRGFMSDDLIGALKEAQAVSQGTRCKQFLFSVSLNPPETEQVGVETFEDAANRIEEATGLRDHPRIIVFHEKEGRHHAHAVWSRIDTDSMTAVNLSHFKNKLRDISRELYLQHDWRMPRGLMNSAEKDPRNFTLAEWQQAKRMGQNARDLKQTMQECWAVSDSRTAFEQALKERGLTLAKGDRRGHVAVTHEGEVLSVARYIGRKAKEVQARLGAPDKFPTVQDAKAQIARDMDMTFKRHLREARETHRRELAPLEAQRRALTQLHQTERQKLEMAQKQRWDQETRARQTRFETGLRGLWNKLTGQHAQIQKQNTEEAFAALQRDRHQRQALIDAQLRDRKSLQAELVRTRQRHTLLLAQLHKERQRYRQMPSAHAAQPIQETKTDKRADKLSDRFAQHAAQPHKATFNRAGRARIALPKPKQPETTPAQQKRAATPSPQDRLQQLRQGRNASRLPIEKGPEQER